MTIITPHQQSIDQLLAQLVAGTLFGSSSSSFLDDNNVLSLRNQHIKDEGLERLLGTLCSPAPQPAIKTNRITGLDLSGNDLTIASIMLLSQSGVFFGPGATLRLLNLSANQLDDSAVQLLVSTIMTQSSSAGYCSLQSVQLDANRLITDASVDCLLDLAVVPAARNIRSVSLEDTLVSRANCALLEEAFRTKQHTRYNNNCDGVRGSGGLHAPVVTSPPPPFNPSFIASISPPPPFNPAYNTSSSPSPPPHTISQQEPSIISAPAPQRQSSPSPLPPLANPISQQQQQTWLPRVDSYRTAVVAGEKNDITRFTGSGHPAVPASVNWEQIHRVEAEREALHLNIRTSRARAILLQQDPPPISTLSNVSTTVAGFSETDSDSELAHTLMLEEYQRLEDKSLKKRIGGIFRLLPKFWDQSHSPLASPVASSSKAGGLSRPYGGSVQSPSITSNSQLGLPFSADTAAYKNLKHVQFFEGAMCVPPDAQLQTWIHNYVLYGIVLSFYIFPISQFSGQKGSSACSLISLENIRLILEATRSSQPPPLEYHFPRAIQMGNQMYRAIGLNYSERDMACNVSMLMANEGIFETLSLISPRENGDPYISVPNPEFGLETFQRLLDRVIGDVQHYLESHRELPFTVGVFVSSSSDMMIGSTVSVVFLRNQDGLGDVLVFDSHSVFAHEYAVVWRIPRTQPQFIEEPIKSFLLSYLGDLSIVEFFHLGIADNAQIQPPTTTPTSQ